MSPLQVLFHQPWMARLGWTLLHFLWQGVLVAALLAVLRARTSGASFRYVSACTALAIMAAAPVVTFLMLGNGDGAAPAGHAAVRAALAAGSGASSSLPLESVWERISPRLGLAWLVGVACCSVRLLGGWLITARLRSANAKPAPVEWQRKLEPLMSRMGVIRQVSLRASTLLEAPVTIGWLRPVILVPVGALAGLSTAQVEGLLAHELAHIRRHDYLVNLLQSLAEAVLFYHPAVWWVSRQIRAEREHCCDDLAIAATGGDVLTYARALTELESCRTAHMHALAATGGSLHNRIRRLVDPSRPATRMAPAGAAWALSAVLLIAVGGAMVRGAESPAPAQEPVVNLKTVWPDTVKQGDVKIEVRGLGTLTSSILAEAKFAETQVKDVHTGQIAAVAFLRPDAIIAAQVQTVHPGVTNGTVTVDLALLAPPPAGTPLGSKIDSTVTIGNMSNVVYVGRPVFATANSEGTLFKLDPDGRHATAVKVQFGRSSVNLIVIKSGLQPGDRVILSDMSAYRQYDRIALQ
ncbi:MAG: M56 family metallopeptidase [Candidatus Sulfopaludibacter sp.]|nr:M56 family metallopeptidase [Candidatus Sulfopaludibacter sp.]